MTPPAAADALRHAVQRLSRSGLYFVREVDVALAAFHLAVRAAGGTATPADLEALIDAHIAALVKSC